MLADAPLVAFVPTVDLPRSQAFYVDMLGLPVVTTTPFATVLDANSCHLRLTPVQEVSPAASTLVGWVVPAIAATVTGLSARGVAFERFGGLDQDELGIWGSPGGDQVAWFRDPDGHLLSLTQPSA